MFKISGLKSVSVLLFTSAILFFYVLRPFQLMKPEPIAVVKLEVFDPERELEKTLYGQQLLKIRDISRSDPVQALKSISVLTEKRPKYDKVIYQAYRLMIFANIAQHSFDSKKVQMYAIQLKELAEKGDLTWLKADSVVELAIEEAKAGNLDSAERQIDTAIAMAESIRYEKLLVKAYNTAGAVFNIRSDLVNAQAYFHKGLELVKQYPDHIYNSKLTSNMALVFVYLEEWQKALELIERGKQLYYRSNLIENGAIALLYINESFIYHNLKDAERSRQAYETAMQLAGDQVNVRLELILLKSQSDLYLLEEDYSRALFVANECLAHPDIDNYSLQKGQCYMNRALASLSFGHDATVLKNLTQALRLYREVGSQNWITTAHQYLAEFYESIGDKENALANFKLYYQGNKKQLFDKRQSELYLLEQGFNTRQIQQDIELLNAEKVLSELLLEKQKLRNRIVASMVFVAIVGLFLLIRRNYRVSKENAQLVEQTTTCSLTGLYNRRYLDRFINSLDSNEGFQFGTSIAVLDLDHFKKINDDFGHDIGDEVLVEVSQRLTRAMGIEGVLVRWGGEEFVCVCGGNGSPTEKLEQLRQSVSAQPISTQVGPLEVTVSVGSVIGLSAKQLSKGYKKYLKQADKALYKAKAQGRNCVVVVSH